MFLITITGPPGSGKDTIIDALLKKFNKVKPNTAARSIYCSTREKRPTDKPGQNIFLISRKDFILQKKKGLIVSTDVSNGDLVGHHASELAKNKIVLASVSQKNIRELKSFVKNEGGNLVSIYLDVPLNIRKARLIKRRDGLEKGYIVKKLKNGVGYVSPKDRKSFEKVYKNPDGKLSFTINYIYKDLQKLLNIN